MPSERTLRDVFWTAAALTQSGQTQEATTAILDACEGGSSDRDDDDLIIADAAGALGTFCNTSALIVIGSDICAVTLRDKLDPTRSPLEPLGDGELMTMELTTPDGQRVSFDDAANDPCCATGLRCITAALNHDLELIMDVLKAHCMSHGLVSLMEVVADLVGLYLTFTEGTVDRGVYDR